MKEDLDEVKREFIRKKLANNWTPTEMEEREKQCMLDEKNRGKPHTQADIAGLLAIQLDLELVLSGKVDLWRDEFDTKFGIELETS